MQSEPNGRWTVTTFRKLQKGYRTVFRRDDEVESLLLPLDLLGLHPELFHHRSNLYLAEFSDRQFQKIKTVAIKYPLKLAIIKRLKIHDFSIGYLFDYFSAKGKYDMTFFDEIIAEVQSEGLINEERTIRDHVKFYMNTKLYGRHFIVQKLLAKRFDPQLVNAVIDEIPESEFMNRANQFRQRVEKGARKQLDNRYKTQTKVERRLLNRGFTEEIAEAVMAEVPYENENAALMQDLDRLKRRYAKMAKNFKYYNTIVKALQRKGYNFYYIDQVFPKGRPEEW